MRIPSGVVAAAMTCAMALGAAACGSSSDDDAGTTTPKSAALTTAQVKDAKGTVTFCVGKDTTGSIGESIKQFNASNTGVTAKLLELPEASDEARAQQVQRLRAKSPECDVLGMDVVWIAEYAAQGWLKDVTPVVDATKGDFIASTVASTKYNNKYWGLPYVTDTGFLYYRKDKVATAPKTWQDVYADAKSDGGLVYQGSKYEGLTVDYLELLFSAGGQVLSPDGKSVAIDSAPARQALDLMVGGVKDGSVPKAVTTYEEEESRRAFEGGRAALMRNWPYAYALGQKSAIKGKFAVAPLPGFGDKPGAGILGGYDLGISAYSRNPAAALKFAQFLTGPQAQKIAAERTFPPTRAATYDDPAVRKVLPFADTLKQAVAQDRPRPVSPVYPQISEAISSHTYAALQGRESTDAAVKGMAADIQKALQTF